MAISLNRADEDIFSGYSKLETPEERIEHKVEGSLMFEGHKDLLKKYEDFLTLDRWSKIYRTSAKITSVLKPEQINGFLQTTIRYEYHDNYSLSTGIFITRLIQNSHDEGNNMFMLNTKVLFRDIDGIGFELKGKWDKSLEIIVEGNVGNDSFERAKNIGKLHIAGNAGDYCGRGAQNINELYIGGNARSECGKGVDDCTFKTPNMQTLQLLKETVSKGKGNKIYFIHPNKEEEEIKW
ncbi:MAG: hypothetical protein ABIB71_06915 [Candidatus Woesearchaeota archaeon]